MESRHTRWCWMLNVFLGSLLLSGSEKFWVTEPNENERILFSTQTHKIY
jgi:hypothetical protein